MPKFLTPLIMGNPILLKKSAEITDIASVETQQLIEDMFFTIQSIGERVGLAAPQVGILKRIVVFRIPLKPVNKRYQNISDTELKEIPWSVLINPKITPTTQELISGWEGCVSVPQIMGKVDRHKSIKYSYFDATGKFHEVEADGFHARVIQHECDHLDGILFPMKVKDMKDFGFESEIVRRL